MRDAMLAAMRGMDLRPALAMLGMRIFLAVPFWQLDDLKGDRGDTGTDHIEFAGGSFGKVYDKTRGEGASVRNADHDLFLVPEVGHPEHRAERERSMSCRELVAVEALTARCLVPVKPFAIPSCQSCEDVIGVVCRF